MKSFNFKTLFWSFLFLMATSGCSGLSSERKPEFGLTVWSLKDRNVSDELALVSLSDGWAGTEEDRSFILLVDLNGKIQKSWKIEGTALNSRLDSKGNLYSLLLTPKSQKVTGVVGEAKEISIRNWKNEKIASIPMPGLSHDFDFVGESQFVVSELRKVSSSEIRKSWPKSTLELGYSDVIKVIDRTGKATWSWDVMEHLKELDFSRDWEPQVSLTHANSFQYLETNPITSKPAFVISFRDIDKVILLEYPSGKILWQSPKGALTRQHDATLQGSQIMVFDNGLGDPPNMSVKEWDVRTNQLVYSWKPPRGFWTTSTMGGARRLGNGSLLLSLGNWGSLIEVNPENKMSWSYLFAQRGEIKGSSWPLGLAFFRAEIYSRKQLPQF